MRITRRKKRAIRTQLINAKENLKETFKPKNFLKRYKRQIIYTLLAIIVILAIIPPATYLYFAKDLKDKDSIMNRSKTGLTLLDSDGQPFFTFYQPKEIHYVSFSEIPKQMQEAVIATEDKNFYTNPGFSIRGMARAFVVNFFAGHVVEGGSTITQELAKNAFLSSSRNVLRKYQELVLATELNRRFSKQDILEMYINSVYFGEGAFGIENAAKAYFGIPASELSLAQSAMLVGILPAPSAFSPLSNDPERALEKQHIVLQQMVEDHYITHDEASQAEAQTLTYNPAAKEDTNNFAQQFAIYVKNKLITMYGEERIIRDGFQVKTTLNRKWQEYAQRTVKNQISYLKRNNASNGAAVVMDPKTGNIEAMVGSYDWDDPDFGKTNMSITPRQPGSSFKPLIYGAALEKKLITPATILEDKETTFEGSYKPHNYDLRYRGNVTVRRALANSLNIPAVEVMQKLGVDTGIDKAKQFGITGLKDAHFYGLPFVLGTAEIPLLQMTNAYATFANQGNSHEPNTILEIKNKYNETVDAGTFLFFFKKSFQSEAKRVISEEAAFLISSILSDNNARAEEFDGALTVNRPAAVKTGTTEDFRDALTIGYTPNLVVGVWVGNNDNTPMDNIAGSLGAAPIWRNLMNTFLLELPIATFHQPLGVIKETICTTQFHYEEYFINGTQIPSCGQPTIPPISNQSPTSNPTPTNQPVTPTPTTIPTNEPTPTQQQTATPAPTTLQNPTLTIPTVNTGI